MSGLSRVPPLRLTSAAVEEDRPLRQWMLRQMARRGWHTQADVVRNTDLKRAQVSEWLGESPKQEPKISSLRKAAEGFGVPILEVLVATGCITAEEAGTPPVLESSLADMTAPEVVEELQRVVEELRRKVADMEVQLRALRSGAFVGLDIPRDEPERRNVGE